MDAQGDKAGGGQGRSGTRRVSTGRWGPERRPRGQAHRAHMQQAPGGQSPPPGPPEATGTETKAAEIKAVIVGDGGCGKTSLLMVFARGDFPKVRLLLPAQRPQAQSSPAAPGPSPCAAPCPQPPMGSLAGDGALGQGFGRHQGGPTGSQPPTQGSVLLRESRSIPTASSWASSTPSQSLTPLRGPLRATRCPYPLSPARSTSPRCLRSTQPPSRLTESR